jgi:hypothetical protein
MKTNSSRPPRPRKEDNHITDGMIYQQLMDSITKLVKNNSQVVDNNNKVVDSCTRLAATNDSLTSIIEKLSADRAQEEIAEEMAQPAPIGETNAPNAQSPGPASPGREEWQYHYSVLNKETREDPLSVLIGFARADSLFQQRQDLYTLFSGAIESDLFQDMDTESVSNWVCFHGTLLRLIEATHRVIEMIKNKRLVFNYLDAKGSG